MRIHDARSLPTVAQEDLRRKAAKAVLEGKSQVEVARIFGVTRQNVGKWIKKYRESGLQGLKAKRQGRPKGGTLLSWQAAQVVRTITDYCPEVSAKGCSNNYKEVD